MKQPWEYDAVNQRYNFNPNPGMIDYNPATQTWADTGGYAAPGQLEEYLRALGAAPVAQQIATHRPLSQAVAGPPTTPTPPPGGGGPVGGPGAGAGIVGQQPGRTLGTAVTTPPINPIGRSPYVDGLNRPIDANGNLIPVTPAPGATGGPSAPGAATPRTLAYDDTQAAVMQTGTLANFASVPMIGPNGERSSIATNIMEPSLRGGWRPVDANGTPYEAMEYNGGWIFGSNQGWVPLNVLTGEGWKPGQQEAINAGMGQGQLPPLEGVPTNPAGGSYGGVVNTVDSNGPYGYGSFAQPFTEEFNPETGTYKSRPWDEDFKFDYDTALNSPAFKLRLERGAKLLENSAAAGGRLYSGRTGKELMRFGQDEASAELEKEYGRAWNEFADKKGTYLTNEAMREGDYNKALGEFRQRHDIFKGNQTDIFNRFAAISGLGQTTGSQLGNQGTAFGNSLGNSIMAAGLARGNGVTNSANARIGGVSNAGGNVTDLLLARQLGLI